MTFPRFLYIIFFGCLGDELYDKWWLYNVENNYVAMSQSTQERIIMIIATLQISQYIMMNHHQLLYTALIQSPYIIMDGNTAIQFIWWARKKLIKKDTAVIFCSYLSVMQVIDKGCNEYQEEEVLRWYIETWRQAVCTDHID